MSWRLADGHTDNDTCTLGRDRGEHLVVYVGRVPDRPRAASPADDHSVPYPPEDKGDGSVFTDRLLMAGVARGLNRQCSIGYHRECSDRDEGADAACRCLCHVQEDDPPLWAGTDQHENQRLMAEVYTSRDKRRQVELETRDTSMIALNEADALSLGRALVAEFGPPGIPARLQAVIDELQSLDDSGDVDTAVAHVLAEMRAIVDLTTADHPPLQETPSA